MPKPNDKLPSLDDLQQKIDEAKNLKGIEKEGDSPNDGPDGIGAAMQVGTELVAGVAVGSIIGYLLDHWLGTLPWFFITCFFLGAAAGFRNLVRQAKKDTGGSDTTK
jgi:ATP synthase protein I